jgi:ABC-type transport system involved in multi-copper enzyme maturation permease subunit
VRVNPVLERELRERVRTRGAPVVLTIFLLLVVALLYLVYRAYGQSAASAFGGSPVGLPAPPGAGVQATDAARVGRGIFEWLLFIALALVLFIVPGLTAAAIAGERERQTLVPMQVTLLRPWQIATGKVGASVAYVCLLLVASLPVLAVASIFGGVGLAEVLRALVAIIFVSVVLACVTVACSAVMRRVQGATVLAYTCTLALLFGTLAAYGAAQAVIEINRPRGTPSRGERAPAVLLALNPVLVTAAAMEGPDLNTPLDSASAAGRSASPFQLTRLLMRPNLVNNGPGTPTGFGYFLPLSVVAMVALALLAIALAARRLRVPAEIQR